MAEPVTDEHHQSKPARRKRKVKKTEEGFSLKLPDGSVQPFPRERFLEFLKHLRIQSRDYGLVPFKLLGSQKYVLDEICAGLKAGRTTFVILKNRQAGISTLLLALDLFWGMENEGLLGVFATHEEQSREQFRNQIKLFLQTIPDGFKIPDETENKNMIVLQNTSLFRYLVAGTRGTTNKMGRSGGCNYLHATEVAFWGSADDLSALNQTLSKIYPHRLYVYETTANGFNFFQEMWEIAKESKAQHAIFVGWWRDERNEFSKDHPLFKAYMPQGAQTSLNQEEQAMVRAVREKYGVQLTAGQMAWYRNHLETNCNNDIHQMRQENPATEEEAFVATGSQFFTNEALTAMMRDAKQHQCLPFVFRLTKEAGDTMVMNSTIAKAELKIWEEPSPWGRYVLGIDSAYGSSDDCDNSIISVGRGYADCVVQVAEYSSAVVQPYQLAWVLAYLAGLYADVMVVLELNGAGHAVYGELKRLRTNMRGVATSGELELKNCLRHMKEFLYRREDSLGGALMKQWVTSPNTKPLLMERYKTSFETGRVRIRSMQALEEHRRIVRDEGRIAASGRSHDDRVIGAALMHMGWDSWIRPAMTAQGKTFAKEMQVERQGGPDIANTLVEKFMSMRGIKVGDVGE